MDKREWEEKWQAQKKREADLREWIKDYIVSFITAEGKNHRRVREYFTLSGPGERFKTSNEDWNTLPLHTKKHVFRVALEQLKASNIVRSEGRSGVLYNKTFLVVNDVLDILAGVKARRWT